MRHNRGRKKEVPVQKALQYSWLTVAVALGAASLTVASAIPGASAAKSSPPARAAVTASLKAAKGGDTIPNLSSTSSPSWQTNNTVWALAVSNGVEYVGGSFTSVRPPGAAIRDRREPTYLSGRLQCQHGRASVVRPDIGWDRERASRLPGWQHPLRRGEVHPRQRRVSGVRGRLQHLDRYADILEPQGHRPGVAHRHIP